MKKKLKIVLLAFVALLLIGGGYLLYIFQFKTYDVADEEVDEIIEDPYDITLPDGTKLVIEQDGKSEGASSGNNNQDKLASGATSTENKSGEPGSDKNSPENSKKPVSQEGTNSSAPDQSAGNGTSAGTEAKPAEKATVAAIKSKYEPTLNNLQGQVDGKINSLIGRAKSEYSSKKANGESIDFGYFYNKYMGAANSLEAQTDGVFEGVVSAMERDLQANGYDKSYAQSARDEYAAKKKARRDSILNKAMGR